jgi:hypothetical protein
MKNPGVFIHVYSDLDQIEPWTVVSMPHPDYMMMLWCGSNPVLKYAGGILLSKNKVYDGIPAYVEDEFRKVLAKHDLDFDKDLFINDNSQCADDEEDLPTPEEQILAKYAAESKNPE